MFENRSQPDQELLRQQLRKTKPQFNHRKNSHWESRQSTTFSCNKEMNEYKMKKDRFLNKLRFIEEKDGHRCQGPPKILFDPLKDSTQSRFRDP